MKKILAFFGLCFFVLISCSANGQVPAEATDFTLTDCDGSHHQLFTQIDNGEVIVIEFMMGCAPCVSGRKALAKLQSQFEASHPGKLHVYTMGFSESMQCNSIETWMTTNNIVGLAFEGNSEVINAYNAQSGMPTIVVLGSTDHQILYWKSSFSNKDTIAIKAAINQGLATAAVGKASQSNGISIYPNPSVSSFKINISCEQQSEDIQIAIYNTIGEQIQQVFEGTLDAGIREFEVTTDKLSNGTYYIHVSRNSTKEIIPITVTP